MYFNTLHPDTARLVNRFTHRLCFPGYLLVGGTAVALYLGHRESNDLDFMTSQPTPSNVTITRIHELDPQFHIISASDYSVHAELEGVRVSYLWQPGIQLNAGPSINHVPLASLDTLAALKCNAIANRGARKDFIDLYAFLQAGWDFDHILEATNHHARSLNVAHLLRNMVYFQDAELDPTPKLYRPWPWSQIKKTIEQTVYLYLQEQLKPRQPTPPRHSGPSL